MNATDLKQLIDSLTQDIGFSYRGVLGSICPFAKDDIALCYGDYSVDAQSVDDAMTIPFVNGKSLLDVADQLDI